MDCFTQTIRDSNGRPQPTEQEVSSTGEDSSCFICGHVNTLSLYITLQRTSFPDLKKLLYIDNQCNIATLN